MNIPADWLDEITNIEISRLCSIEGCGRKHDSRGYCSQHAARLRRHGDPLAGGPLKGIVSAFFNEVVLPYSGKDCLIWPYHRNHYGYAQIRRSSAPRQVCEAVYGSPPTPKHQAAHSCGMGSAGCVNPKHLRWATHAENEEDKRVMGTHSRGEKHANAKLTEQAVKQIRALRGTRLQDVSEQFGVSRSTVSLVQLGKIWSHVP